MSLWSLLSLGGYKGPEGPEGPETHEGLPPTATTGGNLYEISVCGCRGGG